MSQLVVEIFQPGPSDLPLLTDWVFDVIKPYIKGRVLETNSGNGDMALRLITHGFWIQLNATSEIHRELLRTKFEGTFSVKGIHKINFLHSRMEVKYLDFQDHFDTILAFNIDNGAEQTFYNKQAIAKALRLLRTRGRVIMVGPAEDCFLPGTEQDPEVLKEYNFSRISDLLSNCQIELIRFFNCNGLYFVAVGRKII